MHSSVTCCPLSASDDDISYQLELLYYPADLSGNNAPDPIATGQTSTRAVKAMLETTGTVPKTACLWRMIELGEGVIRLAYVPA